MVSFTGKIRSRTVASEEVKVGKGTDRSLQKKLKDCAHIQTNPVSALSGPASLKNNFQHFILTGRQNCIHISERTNERSVSTQKLGNPRPIHVGSPTAVPVFILSTKVA